MCRPASLSSGRDCAWLTQSPYKAFKQWLATLFIVLIPLATCSFSGIIPMGSSPIGLHYTTPPLWLVHVSRSYSVGSLGCSPTLKRAVRLFVVPLLPRSPRSFGLVQYVLLFSGCACGFSRSTRSSRSAVSRRIGTIWTYHQPQRLAALPAHNTCTRYMYTWVVYPAVKGIHHKSGAGLQDYLRTSSGVTICCANLFPCRWDSMQLRAARCKIPRALTPERFAAVK